MKKKLIILATILASFFLAGLLYIRFTASPAQACTGACTDDCYGCNTVPEYDGEICDPSDCGYMEFCCSSPPSPDPTPPPVGGPYNCGGGTCPDGASGYTTYCDQPCGTFPNTCFDDPACPGAAIDCRDSPGYCESLDAHCGAPGCGTVFCAIGGDCQTSCESCASPPPPPGGATVYVCKVIIDTAGNITNGYQRPGTTFTLPGLYPNPKTSQGDPWSTFPTTTFTTPLTLNTDLFYGDGIKDAQCIPHYGLEQGGNGYYYGQEIIGRSGWKPPKYNDGIDGPASGPGDFFEYSPQLFDADPDNDGGRNISSDGHIIIQGDTRTLVVLNQIGTPPLSCDNPLTTDQLTKVVMPPNSVTVQTPSNWEDALDINTPVIATNVPPPSPLPSPEPYILPVPKLEVKVDFSKLGAVFAPPNSNYLEGYYQDEAHRLENLTTLSAPNFNDYHGPAQKAAPIAMTDMLRVNYAAYVQANSTLAESDYQYADFAGENLKTVAQMWADFGGEPKPPSLGGDPAAWQSTWARYWDKIPTAVNQPYYGILTLNTAAGTKAIEEIKIGESCAGSRQRRIYFIMPEYFRTASIVNQINQLIVPKAAQSSTSTFVETTLGISQANPRDAFAKMLEAIFQPFAGIPIQDIIPPKIKKATFEFLNPVKDVFAKFVAPPSFLEPPEVCPIQIPIQENDLEGRGPFCPLKDRQDPRPGTDPMWQDIPHSGYILARPESQLRWFDFLTDTLAVSRVNEFCNNDPDNPYKLDPSQNVFCTFYQTFTKNLVVTDSVQAVAKGWDSCERVSPPTDPAPSGACTPGETYSQCGLGDSYGEDACALDACVSVPWLCNASGVWENANPKGECYIGCTTCRPAKYTCKLTVNVYPTFYIPWLAPIWNNTAYSNEASDDIAAIFGKSLPKTGKFGQKTGRPGIYTFFKPQAADPTVFPKGKNLPSEDQGGTEDIRQRFFGTTECNKRWSRDIALKPKALQEFLGIVPGCPAE